MMRSWLMGRNAKDDRGDARWKPVRVRAKMAEPLVYYGDGLHLDGLMAWAAWQRARESKRCRAEIGPLPPIEPVPVDYGLPLAVWTQEGHADVHPSLRNASGDVWGWCCSAVQAQWAMHGTLAIRKKPAVDSMIQHSKDAVVQSSAGRFKAHDLKLPTRMASVLEWWCLGCEMEIRELVCRVTHIGRKKGLGNGRVLEWEVGPMPDDWSLERDEQTTRVMPAFPDETPEIRAAIRAPYWHQTRMAPAMRPEVGG